MIRTRSKQAGFTLVELLLATAMFSFILLFVTAGIIQVNRAYNKGLTVKQMHQNARDIIDTLTRAVLEAESIDDVVLPSFAANRQGLCIGSRYQFQWVEGYVDHEYYDSLPGNEEGYSVAQRLDTFTCADIGLPTTGNIQILTSDLVAVQDIELTKDVASNSVRILVRLASNHQTTNFSAIQPCEPTDSYCDFVALETLVTLRR